MKKKRFCKVALERVSRTDLICIGCGCFRTEWAIVSMGGAEPVAGLHTKCIPGMHVRHTRKVKTSGDASDVAETESHGCTCDPRASSALGKHLSGCPMWSMDAGAEAAHPS